MATEESAIVEQTMTMKEARKEKKERKKAEKKKSKKRKKSDDESDSDIDQSIKASIAGDSKKNGKDEEKIPKKKKKKEIKSRLKSKKEEKAELMKKIPLENEDGIAYTKFQIRQMMKRVKRGLPAVATPKELEEKRQNEARLRREEEAELAGLASTRNRPDSEDDEDGDAEEEGDDDSTTGDEQNGKGQEPDSSASAADNWTPALPVVSEDGKPKKKPKTNKPVPADYVCAACKNRHEPLHWIYDCPHKVTMRGTNKKKKRERGMNDPDSKKVFVSGLPFDVKVKGVEDFFSITKNCGTVAAVRLVKFEDTKRCNGQAYVSFDTDEGAKNAIKLSGITLDVEALTSSSDGDSSKKKKNDEGSSGKRKVLKLKVSKVLNRRKTKTK